jgi:hypothetical protein
MPSTTSVALSVQRSGPPPPAETQGTYVELPSQNWGFLSMERNGAKFIIVCNGGGTNAVRAQGSCRGAHPRLLSACADGMWFGG